MLSKKYVLIVALSTLLFSDNLQLKYSYGLHDFNVKDNTNAWGINAGVYASYQPTDTSSHDVYFEIFTEYDDKELDPDHIPIWFRANYEYRLTIASQDRFNLNGLYQLNWKMNTASSVEQYLKSGAGFEFAFKDGALAFSPKVIAGAYYLEIDDDVPSDNGFSRSDLDVGYKAAIMYGLDVSWKVTSQSTLALELEEWNEKGQWLERYASLTYNYSGFENFDVVLSGEKTVYNLDNFRKEGQDILPWNQDALIKLSVLFPF